jgi:hypothetical protein
MIGDTFIAVAAMSLLAAIIKITSIARGSRSAGHWLLCGLFVSLCFSCLFLSTSVQIALDHVHPNLGRLLSNDSTLVAAFTMLSLLLMLSRPPEQAKVKIRRRFFVLVAAASSMTALFLVTPLPPVVGDFGNLYRVHPTLLGYIAIFVAFFGTALTELFVLSWRYAHLARHRRPLRFGLQFMAAGSFVGLVYLAEKVVYIATEWLGLSPPLGADRDCTSLIAPAQCAFSVALPTVAVVLLSVGATLPVWAPALRSPVSWVSQERTYRRLEPLWTALHEAVPEIALIEPAKPRVRPQRDLGHRLYRRVIEILDGCLALRPYRDTQVAEAALAEARKRGLSDSALRATVEAAQIAAALEARRAGHPSRATSTQMTKKDSGDEGRTDLPSEASWLAEVSTAFASSPIVKDHARRVRDSAVLIVRQITVGACQIPVGRQPSCLTPNFSAIHTPSTTKYGQTAQSSASKGRWESCPPGSSRATTKRVPHSLTHVSARTRAASSMFSTRPVTGGTSTLR